MDLDETNLVVGAGLVSSDLMLWMVRECRPPQGQMLKLDWHLTGRSGASSNFNMVGVQLGAMFCNEWALLVLQCMALRQCEQINKGLQMVLGVSRLKSGYLHFPVTSEAHPTGETTRVAIAQLAT